jgi:hypothetical protein
VRARLARLLRGEGFVGQVVIDRALTAGERRDVVLAGERNETARAHASVRDSRAFTIARSLGAGSGVGSSIALNVSRGTTVTVPTLRTVRRRRDRRAYANVREATTTPVSQRRVWDRVLLALARSAT